MESEDQENEFSVTGDISDKLANPEETSKAKKKRKAQEKMVSIPMTTYFQIVRLTYPFLRSIK